MFQKLLKTDFPPKVKPLMVYDGNCGFCKYWIVKWKKITKNTVEYAAYQKVERYFLDIETIHFREAVRYIELDGTIISGPDAAFITFSQQGKLRWLHQAYRKGGFFMRLCDLTYQLMANNRGLMFQISKALLGSDPNNSKPYWLIYIIAMGVLIASLIFAWPTNI